MFASISNNQFAYLWSKYRPAILRLMIDAADSPQEYQLSGHEFKSASTVQKGTFSFTLCAFKGRAMNDIKNSTIAKGLLEILNHSKTASELMETSKYEFKLDRNFVLHVKPEEQEEEKEEEQETKSETEIDSQASGT